VEQKPDTLKNHWSVKSCFKSWC